jgi:GNAT superfamily N-acetyltransferase
MSAVEIRLATRADSFSFAPLLAEMQRHYGQPVPEQAALEAATLLCHLPAEGFNPRTLLAVADGAVIGSCVLNVMMPAAELRRSLYIRDLFVSATTRRRGIGRALVRAAAQLVVEGGFCALDWTMDARNDPARRLYVGCEAAPVDRTYFRLTGATLARVAESDCAVTGDVAHGAESLLDQNRRHVEMRAGSHAAS